MSNDKITQENINEYIKKGGEYCPFCKSSEVVQDGIMFYDEEESKVYKGMTCLTCNRDWTDVFKLDNILPTMPGILEYQKEGI